MILTFFPLDGLFGLEFVSASAISENIEMWVDLYPVLHCTVGVDLGRPLPPIPLLAPLGVTP